MANSSASTSNRSIKKLFVGEGAIQAFGLDRAKLASPDPNVSGRERLRLMQGLIDSVCASLARSPEVAQARRGYDLVVAELAARGVSVVVPTGNNGGAEIQLARAATYPRREPEDVRPLMLPPGFYDNALSNSQTTTVGGVRFSFFREPLEGQIHPASSPSSQVAFLANATVVERGEEGTSFASPRVAAAFAKEHGGHPGLSPAQARNLIEQAVVAPVLGVEGQVVHPELLAKFLRG